MTVRVAISTVWVLDQDSAKDFYTTKLGFEVREDVMMGPQRWLTVSSKDQLDLRLTLMLPAPPALDPESAEQIKALVAKGAMGAGVLSTDDCEATYAQWSARGVEFLQKPTRRPYGVEALMRDDSGNWFSLTQQFGSLDSTVDWANGSPVE